MDLFLDKVEDTGFFKMAGFAARVSETPENWPQELTSEIMRQLPYLSDYEVNVNLQSTDPQRGYGFGYADVTARTERPEAEHAHLGIPHIRIPVIIKDRAVKPFNVFLDGERVVPLTEERVRQTLFNPQAFDLSSSAPRDPSLVESMMPPTRTGPGMGGEYKVASANLYQAIHNTKMQYIKNRERKEEKGKEASVQKTSTIGGYVKAVQKKPNLLWKTMEQSRSRPVEMQQRFISNLTAADPRIGRAASQMQSQLSPQRMESFIQTDPNLRGVLSRGNVPPATPRMAVGDVPAGQTAVVRSRRPSALPQAEPAYTMTHTGDPGIKYVYASVLDKIASTIRPRDAEKFIDKVASDPTIIAGFRRSGVAEKLVSIFDSIQESSPGDYVSKLASSIEPTVMTFMKLPGGSFLVKSAATDAFVGGPQAQGVVMPPQQAAEMIGPQNAQAMLPGQSATAVANPAEQVQSVSPSPLPPETDDVVIDQFGQWMVQDLMGNRLSGWVFPTTLAWDGNFTAQPMALFTNGSAYAFQDAVAGELVGKSTTLPSDVPRGDGCFYLIKGGKAVATQPVTISSSMSGPDGLPKFVGTDAFGKSLQVSFVPGIKEPTRLSDIEFGFPDTWKFMRLNNQTQLVSDPVQMNKMASVRSDLNSVELIYNGSYHLRGQCGLDKVAYELKNDLDPVSAEFMLGVLGVDGTSAKSKIAEARRRGVVKMSGLHSITTFEERLSSNVKTASVILANVPDLRCDLVKEAAFLDEESTINNVLALNFINPENLHTFINYIPDLEMTSEHLAEMWLYSVMGMNELPEDHIERAMKNMEHVIEGLKAIAHAEI